MDDTSDTPAAEVAYENTADEAWARNAFDLYERRELQVRAFDTEGVVSAQVWGPCPRCGHEDFNLVDGYVSLPLQAKVTEGPAGSFPTVVTLCERCGYVSQHALSVLLASEIDGQGGTNGSGPG